MTSTHSCTNKEEVRFCSNHAVTYNNINRHHSLLQNVDLLIFIKQNAIVVVVITISNSITTALENYVTIITFLQSVNMKIMKFKFDLSDKARTANGQTHGAPYCRYGNVPLRCGGTSL